MKLPIVDGFGRVHANLRISVTDRCNIRCTYCMPADGVRFLPRPDILTFEEMTRLVRIMAGCGLKRIRLTGGEPLVRADLPRLVAMLNAIPQIREVAMTTNGILLDRYAEPLRRAGLARLNISLDTLDEQTFQRLTRRPGLERVLEGIRVAQQVGFDKIRLNAIAMKGLTETEVVPLVRFAMDRGLELRFIEFMPLDAEQAWQSDQVLSGERIRQIIQQEFGPLRPADRVDAAQPAIDFVGTESNARVGFIESVTRPFCARCDRMRLLANGQFRNCLFSDQAWDLKALLRNGATDEAIEQGIRQAIAAKKAGHGTDSFAVQRPSAEMHQIGG